MRVGIVVPAFNVAPFLRQALQSVLDQTYYDWSLVIVVDGSTDATDGVVAEFVGDRIHLIHQDNAGVSAARNRGVRYFEAAAADALLFLDGDDWLAPNALARLAETLESAPWAVAACARYARISSEGECHVSRAPLEGCVLERLLIQNLFANGGHLLIRREAIEVAGYFRDDLSYGEDWEYWARLASFGEFASAHCREPLLFVRERVGSAMLSSATDPAVYVPAMKAIHCNPELAGRVGKTRLAYLRRRAEAEMAWTVGRELIRHGQQRKGLRWLWQSVWNAPSLRRLVLITLSWPHLGPFRRYRVAA